MKTIKTKEIVNYILWILVDVIWRRLKLMFCTNCCSLCGNSKVKASITIPKIGVDDIEFKMCDECSDSLEEASSEDYEKTVD